MARASLKPVCVADRPRVAKYNQLLRIDKSWASAAGFPGRKALAVPERQGRGIRTFKSCDVGFGNCGQGICCVLQEHRETHGASLSLRYRLAHHGNRVANDRLDRRGTLLTPSALAHPIPWFPRDNASQPAPVACDCRSASFLRSVVARLALASRHRPLKAISRIGARYQRPTKARSCTRIDSYAISQKPRAQILLIHGNGMARPFSRFSRDSLPAVELAVSAAC